jgi:hypothetical protein
MRSFLCVSGYALVAAGLCLAAAAPAHAGGCNKLIGTADGWNKPDALSGAQSALAEAVADFKKGRGAVTITAMRAKPQPYWRDSVSAELFLKPDVVTAKSHTVCWKGVVSPVVCTSGAKVCW